MKDKSKKVVACLGASSTAARGPYDWIHDLEQRPGNSSFRFYRFAAGGDLAYNAVQRLPQVFACHPDYVIVLIGGNDVMASIPKKSMYYRVVLGLTKHLPRRPSLEWYRESMQAIVHGLKNNTSAHIALCSSQPWGEDPGFTDPYQGELNRRFAKYNKALKDIASTEGVGYLPFYERMEELIIASPGRAFTSSRFCHSIAISSGSLSCTRVMMKLENLTAGASTAMVFT
jgi:hypothetical protein